MRIVSLNIARPAQIPWRGRMIATGIYKEPVAGPRRVTRLRIEGDFHADLSAHGGLNKAVYGYPHEHYAYWRETLGTDGLPFGQFGENLTTEGLLETSVRLGDVYRAGTALLQASAPREPCYKLAVRIGRSDFVKQFFAARRLGFYFRVLEEGELRAGDAITRVEADPQGVSLRDVADLLYAGLRDENLFERALAVQSLSPRLRAQLERRRDGPTDGEF